MKDSTKIFIILLVIISLAFVSVIQSCKVNKLKKEVDSYKAKTELLNDSLDVVISENKRLRDMMMRANTALEKMVEKEEKAKDVYDERNEKIDDADTDWLMCPLPDDVREAFGTYCYGYAGSKATHSITDSMRKA